MMKRVKIKYTLFTCMVTLSLLTLSCEEYLDKAPEADITDQEVFGDFEGFQGYTEELYHCIPDYVRSTWVADWNLADEVLPIAANDWRLIAHFDNGDYWYWYTTACGWNQSYLYACDGVNTDAGDPGWFQKGLWNLAWYGIRKANLGLANLDLLVDATQEEKELIEGQLLFFRGFLHFQLMSFWGGLPYIDEVLGSEALTLPRLSYRETALRAAEDLEAAAALLPADWDNTVAGQATYGNNFQRVTKSTAWAYLGKNLLYAASPLMNRESTGNASYDAELCQSAAEAFHNCLSLSNSGQAPYQLIEWDRYEENFYTLNADVPGFPESLMTPRFYWNNIYYDVTTSLFLPDVLGGDGNMVSPSADYVENFGMENGLPIDAEGSDYDPADPWTGRDPRFYKFIVHDGVRVIEGGTEADDYRRYANLHNDGNFRSDLGSRTGYLFSKFIPMSANQVDNVPQRFALPGYMRLADVYLMYAEAVLHGYGSAESSYPADNGYTLTAVDAVNTIRERANVGAVDSRFIGSVDAFMGEIIRERAVELMGEANIRFMDIRRWLVAEDLEYREKTAIDFDRGADGKPINMRRRVVLTRVFENKHYWLPLPTDQVNIYPEFGQNPGW